MTATAPIANQANRLCWLDNLRTFIIFLVIVCHAGGVYERSGIWASFWIVDDPSTNNLSGLLILITDLFMMPTLFFISGFFVPLSVKSKSGWEFLASKAKRLIVPWLIASLTLIPAYKVIFLHARGLPQENWTTYFHWSNGIWCQNWLWFLPVLFLFDVLYLLLSKSKLRIPNLSLKGAILGAFLIGFVYCLAMDLLGLRGWTHSALLDFQNERLLIHFMAFLLGALCYKLKTFEAKPKGKLLYIFANTFAWIPITSYMVFLLAPLINPGNFIVSRLVDRSILWLSYELSLLCLVYLAINTFRRYQDGSGRLRSELNRNSYYVYIIHVIVMGSFAITMIGKPIPSLLKHLALTVATFAASNLLVSLCRRLAGIAASTGAESECRVTHRVGG